MEAQANGNTYAELVTKAWITNANGATRKGGVYKVLGFTGDYESNVSYRGKEITGTYTLTTKSGALTVSLK